MEVCLKVWRTSIKLLKTLTVISSKTSPLTFSTLILNSSFFFSRIITASTVHLISSTNNITDNYYPVPLSDGKRIYGYVRSG